MQNLDIVYSVCSDYNVYYVCYRCRGCAERTVTYKYWFLKRKRVLYSKPVTLQGGGMNRLSQIR